MKEARSPQQIADACGVIMHEKDRMARLLGIVLDETAPGRARVSMTVRDDMANGMGTCHGGIIFALADCAFAYSCNSRNRKTVAAGASIDFVMAARPGDRLTAVAEERALVGRTGIYDVRIVDQNDELVAFFRGRARGVAGTVSSETEESIDFEESTAPGAAEKSKKR